MPENIVSIIAKLRCIQKKFDRFRCGGKLRDDGSGLTCETCGHEYRQIRGVPVLHDLNWNGDSERWFEAMYQNRSRIHELKSSYLSSERQLMKDFVTDNKITGLSLEIGCGVGLFAALVPQFLGLEFVPSSLLAEGFELFNRICADARAIPIADESAELIFSFNTLEHVPEVHQVFEEMHRVLQPNGFLVLKPAWHCTRYTTELIPVLPYRTLSLWQKLTKALLPILASKPYKFLTKIPVRIWRRMTYPLNPSLQWKELTPYYGKDWIPDADAVANIDCHEAILFYLKRDYLCLSHPSVMKQLLAGHDVVILQKNQRS